MSAERETHRGMKSIAEHIRQKACRMVCVVGLVCSAMCGLSSCGWQEAKDVIAVADSLDQTEHVIYDDTAALGRTIHSLDNPFGRVLMSNTLGKAYYYMGRNLEDYHQQVAGAARCYIEADRLQIDDPIFRGRINACMGYICRQNNRDSLALIFYERATEHFKESENEWYYAQSLLNITHHLINLRLFSPADSLLRVAQEYQMDNAYHAQWLKTRGHYCYMLQQYDSALVHFYDGLNYLQKENDSLHYYLKIMQSYYFSNKIDEAIHYAQILISHSNNPNYISNAYYCLMQDAERRNDAQLLSLYSQARTDAQRLLRENMIQYAEALPLLAYYLQNPHPWRWVWIMLTTVIAICIFLAIGVMIYRQRTRAAYEQIMQYRLFGEQLSNIVDKYHIPHKRWKEYKTLKKDLSPWLHDWMHQLDKLPLSEREKVFCTISLVYPHMTDIEIATYICYDKSGIRVFKQRISKKIGTTSANLLDFLRKLPLKKK